MFFSEFDGITATSENFDRLAKIVGTSIKFAHAFREEGCKKTALTGTLLAGELKAVW